MFENVINIKLQYYKKCEFDFTDESQYKIFSVELLFTKIVSDLNTMNSKDAKLS